MISNNCLHCEKRYLGCHLTCESYLKYKEQLEKIKTNKRNYRLLHTGRSYYKMENKEW